MRVACYSCCFPFARVKVSKTRLLSNCSGVPRKEREKDLRIPFRVYICYNDERTKSNLAYSQTNHICTEDVILYHSIVFLTSIHFVATDLRYALKVLHFLTDSVGIRLSSHTQLDTHLVPHHLCNVVNRIRGKTGSVDHPNAIQNLKVSSRCRCPSGLLLSLSSLVVPC